MDLEVLELARELTGVVRDSQLQARGECDDWVERAMAVVARELVEPPQRMGSEGLAQSVRLQSLDDCLGCWVDAGELSGGGPCEEPGALLGSTLPILVPDDRELRGLLEILGQRDGVAAGEVEREEVEARSGVVEEVADDCREVGGERFDGLESDDLRVAFSVVAMADRVMVTVKPRFAAVVEVLQVVERPKKLQFRFGELSGDTGSPS